MSLLFVNEKYDLSSFLSSNVGDWVDAEIELLHYVNYEATTVEQSVKSFAVGGVWWFELLDGSDWSDHGYANTKAVDVLSHDNAPSVIVSTNIDYLDGNKMFFTSDPTILSDGQYPQFSNSGVLIRYIKVTQASAPEKMELDFNLTKTNVGSLNSLIDGEVNRFKTLNISALGIGGTHNLTQINNKSGGLIEDVVLTLVSNTDNKRIYSLTYKFFNWVYLQSGFNEPQWFNGIDTVGCVNRLRSYAEYNNPNTVMTTVSQNIQGNAGGFNENFNTGNPEYSLSSVDFTDALDVPTNGISYCDVTKFTAVIDAPVGELDTVESRFTIGLTWRPTDESYYQHKLTHLGINLGVNAPKNIFSHAVVPNPTPYNGFINPNFRWSFKELQFEIVGDTIEVSGEIFPTTDNSFFDTLSDGEKKHTLWVSSYRNDTPNNQRLKTSVILYDKDVECAPVLGTALFMGKTTIYDHGGNEISNVTTTEDDVFVTWDVFFDKNITYDNLKVGFEMYNYVTEESFNLEQFTFNFDSMPFIGGVYQANETIQRNFNLPPTTDRNEIKLTISSESPTDYYLRISYSWLNNWRYWLANSNTSDDFYSITEPNNGLNKNWQKYTEDFNWILRSEILREKDGISGFNYQNFIDRPYEDEDVTETTTFVDLSDGSTPTSLVADTFMEVTTNLTWNTGVYEPIMWAEVTIEDYESGNRWVLSSVLPQGNIAANPLKSIIASDKLQLTAVGNVATLKYKIDTSIVNADKVSISSRIYSGLEVTDFESRVLADGGTFEAKQCLINIINELL